MKQTAVTIMAMIAYVIDLQKTGNKTLILKMSDKWLHESGLFQFLTAIFDYNGREKDSVVVWLDNSNAAVMPEDLQRKYILPLTALPQAEMEILCKRAGITLEELYKFMSKINLR